MHKYQQYRERAAAAVEARNVIRKACEIGSSGTVLSINLFGGPFRSIYTRGYGSSNIICYC